MKKLLVVLLSLMMIFIAVACTATPAVTEPAATEAPTATEAPADNPAHTPLIAALGHDPSTLDQLISRSGLTADVVLAMLTELSLEGIVTNLPGGRYQRLIRS